jgi:hypothetical protein
MSRKQYIGRGLETIYLHVANGFRERSQPVPVVQVLALATHEVNALEDVHNVVDPSPFNAQFRRRSVQADLGNLVISVQLQEATATEEALLSSIASQLSPTSTYFSHNSPSDFSLRLYSLKGKKRTSSPSIRQSPFLSPSSGVLAAAFTGGFPAVTASVSINAVLICRLADVPTFLGTRRTYLRLALEGLRAGHVFVAWPLLLPVSRFIMAAAASVRLGLGWMLDTRKVPGVSGEGSGFALWRTGLIIS